jgi:hypothetical protein
MIRGADSHLVYVQLSIDNDILPRLPIELQAILRRWKNPDRRFDRFTTYYGMRHELAARLTAAIGAVHARRIEG